MSKKLCFLISLVLVLTLASTSYGADPCVIIGNWESQMDGWTVEVNVISTDYNDTYGVTLDGNSLKLNTISGYENAIVYSLTTQGKVNDFRNNLKVSADVTRLANEWTEGPSAYCELFLAVSAGNSVAGDGDPNWDLSVPSSESADWKPADGNAPMTVIYDYSSALPDINFASLEYLEFYFVSNWGDYTPGGIYYLDNVKMFGGGAAYVPNPADGARKVPVNTNLSWVPGVYADKHDVYFGTNFNDVNDANRTNDPYNVLVSQDQDPCTYDPCGLLDSGKRYYWRIDEVNDNCDPCLWKGDVWQFTTRYLGSGLVIGDFEDSNDNWYTWEATSANPYLGNATLNKWSLKVAVPSAWKKAIKIDLSNPEDLQYATGLHIDVTLIASEWTIGTGWVKPIECLIVMDDVSSWQQIAPDTSYDWGGSSDQTFNIDFAIPDQSGTNLTWGSLVIVTMYSGVTTAGNFYIDNIRLFDSRSGSNPHPAHRATGVRRNPVLRWTAGDYAAKHDIYLGTNLSNVTDANNTPGVWPEYEGNQPVSDCNYALGLLAADTNYYWRIDAVNEAGPDPCMWEGGIWSFTTGNYFVMDDMDSYGPDPELRDVWKDSSTGTLTNNGAQLFVETDPNFACSGKSMRYYFRNMEVAGKYVGSEAEASAADLGAGTDWTVGGIKAMVLYFYGDADNLDDTSGVVGGIHQDQMWVAVDDGSTEGVVEYDGDMNAIKEPYWHEWNIDLQDPCLIAVDMNNVVKVYIGFGGEKIGQTAAGAGKDTYAGDTVWFDDIELHPRRCTLSERSGDFAKVDYVEDCVIDYEEVDVMAESWLVEAVNAGEVNLVGWWKLDGNAIDSSGEDNNGTIQGNPQWVAGHIGSNSLDFNGINDYVDCGNDVSLDVTDQITLSVWVKTDDCGNGEYNPYVTKGDQAYGIKHINTNNIEFAIYDGAFYTTVFPVDSSFNGVWHHLAGTYDGSQLKLYLDGILKDSKIYTGSIATNTFVFDIAANSEQAGRYYDGVIDDARIYNRALSQAEVAYLAGSDWRLDLREDQTINFKDYALMADKWLEDQQFPY